VTGFGLLGQRSHVKANTYSTLLEAAFLIIFKIGTHLLQSKSCPHLKHLWQLKKKQPHPSKKQTPSLTLFCQTPCTLVWNGS